MSSHNCTINRMKKLLVIVLVMSAATIVPAAIALLVVRKYHSSPSTELQLNQVITMETSSRLKGALVLGDQDVEVNDGTVTAIQETVRD